jgi:two-component system sensor histidine kinase VanS
MNMQNFSIKIFIGIICILLAVGLLVFGILRIFLPKVYENELKERIETDTAFFLSELDTESKMYWWGDKLEQFCSSNNINATVFFPDGKRWMTTGIQLSALTDYKKKHSSFDIISALKFHYITIEEDPIMIAFYYNPKSTEQVTDTFDTMFPILFIMVFIISLVIAFFYTRFMVKNKNLQIANAKLQSDIKEEQRRKNFFSALSHELKTPVTILKGELDGMILNVGKFKDRDKYLQEAYETTESIEELTKEITTVSKLDIVKIMPEEVILSEITRDCLVKINELTERKHLQITQEISDLPIFADKKLIRIALSNIIGNAVKHSPHDSKIEIRFDDMLKFTVTNHSAYIGENASESDLSGGLGLYIVKSVLDMHGFRYSFENNDDTTLFSIDFTKM